MDLMNDVMSRWSRTIRVFILQLIVLGLGLYDTFHFFGFLAELDFSYYFQVVNSCCPPCGLLVHIK